MAATAILNDPPTAPGAGNTYIVGAKPTGAFTSHANEVALWDGVQWTFTAAQKDEAHLNQADNTIYHWSGKEWNKIGTTGADKLASLTDVDLTTVAPSQNDSLLYDATAKKWVPGTTQTSARFLLERAQASGKWRVVIPDSMVGKIRSLSLDLNVAFSDYAHMAVQLLQGTNHLDCDVQASYRGLYASVVYNNAVAQHYARPNASNYERWLSGNALCGTWWGENLNDAVGTFADGWWRYVMKLSITPGNGMLVHTEYQYMSYEWHAYYGWNKFVLNASTSTPYENISGFDLWGGLTHRWGAPGVEMQGFGELKVELK